MTECGHPGEKRCAFQALYQQNTTTETSDLIAAITENSMWPDASLIEATLEKKPHSAMCVQCGLFRSI